jgi:hypothetical protein
VLTHGLSPDSPPWIAISYQVLSVLFMKDFDRHCAIAFRETQGVALQLSSTQIRNGAVTDAVPSAALKTQVDRPASTGPGASAPASTQCDAQERTPLWRCWRGSLTRDLVSQQKYTPAF